MADYNSSYTGEQIDAAIGKALNPDTTPTANSTALITSGGVKSALPTVSVVTITKTTGTGGGAGLLSVPKSEYPDVSMLIPANYDTNMAYRLGIYDITSASFRFVVEKRDTNVWADNVSITFKAYAVKM